ncbi:hypothetical protein Zmor_018795, partial [Zophobas morio]
MFQNKKKKIVISNVLEDVHPKDNSNFLSHFFFCWQLQTLFKVSKNRNVDDKFTVPVEAQESRQLGEKFENTWNRNKNPSLMKTLVKMFGLEFALCGLIYSIPELLSTFLQPVYLGKLLEYFLHETPTSQNQAFVYGLIIVTSVVLRVLSFQFYMMEAYSIGLKVRTACSSLIYRKLLRFKILTKQKIALGQLINMLSNDVEKYEFATGFFHRMWIAVLKLAIGTTLLSLSSGLKGVAGIAVLGLIIFFQCFVYKTAATLRTQIVKERDTRLSLMNAIIFRMQAIKMYVWEKPFAQLVQAARKAELDHISKQSYIFNENFTFFFYVNKISIYVFILLLIVSGTPLDPKVVFMTMNIYNLLILAVKDLMIGAIPLSEIKVSTGRIQKFLFLDEDHDENPETNLGDYRIVARKVAAKWDPLGDVGLTNIDFKLRRGELVALVGAIGSGKSSLIYTILKELPISSGTLSSEGLISYAPQTPWVVPGTIRDNITFGERFDNQKYLKVLRMCALEHDISRLPHGDNTLVGERGTSLSGGQKARVSLARAVYKDADIYLLDDPLAAVDASVAQTIFTHCFLNHLKNKSIILVTHQLKFLKNVDRIYVLEDGKIKDCGKYEALAEVSLQNESRMSQIPETKLEKYTKQSEVKEDVGNSTTNTYKTYLFLGKPKLFIYLQLFLFVTSQAFLNGSDVFLSFWINFKGPSSANEYNRLYIYSGFVLVAALLYHFTSWSSTKCCKQSSIKLHDTLFNKILHCSMKFFSDHDSGRIINRVSRDMAIVDEYVPIYMYQTIRLLCVLLGVCCVVIVMNYYVIFPTVILWVIFCYYLRNFQPGLNSLKKIAVTRKSPLFTHVVATMEGLTTIKALKAQTHCLSKFEDHQNRYNSIGYLYQALYHAFNFWIDFACMLYIAVVFLCLIIVKQDGLVGNVGLSITETLLLIASVQATMKFYNDLDLQMISVERVAEYGDLIVEEDEGTLIPPPSWPSAGQIQFQSLSMRYSPE